MEDFPPAASRRRLLSAAALCTTSAACRLAGSGAQPQTARGSGALELVNGRWFDGKGFRERTVFVTGEVLAFTRPARVERAVDLKGGFVVPPFGEAHNHNVEPSARLETTLRSYLQAGVFYVKNPANLPRARAAMAGKINRPGAIDVAFANGVLTATDGHPVPHARRNIERKLWSSQDGAGAFYFLVDTLADLEAHWPAVLAGRPDFIKVMLLHSEAHARRRLDRAFVGWKGLDPRLLPAVVDRAHQAGLRVCSHVETAADFHHALVGGVDEIGHLPGFRGDEKEQLTDPSVYEIQAADAKLAAARGVVVVTTVADGSELDPQGVSGPLGRRLAALHRRNLLLLKQHRVRLAIGSDAYDDNSSGEIDYLQSLEVFTPLELLKMWAETTPRTIFPGRKIGLLEPGHEASFLVLAGDPLRDFANVKRIGLRFKQGAPLPLPAATSGG